MLKGSQGSEPIPSISGWVYWKRGTDVRLRFARNRFVIRLEDTELEAQRSAERGSRTQQGFKTPEEREAEKRRRAEEQRANEAELTQRLDRLLQGFPDIRVVPPYRFIGSVAVVDIDGPDDESGDRRLLQILDRLKLDGVVLVAPDLLLVSATDPPDPDTDNVEGHQWGWLRIGMENVWRRHSGNSHAPVAVFETGFFDHPDLDTSRVKVAQVISGSGPIPGTVFSTNPGLSIHGLQVAGLIAATQANAENTTAVYGNITGVNAGSPLHLYRATSVTGDDALSTEYLETVQDAVNRAEVDDLKIVINLSWVANYEAENLDAVDPTDDGLGSLLGACNLAMASQRVILCCGASNSPERTAWPARFAKMSVPGGGGSYGDVVVAVGATTIDAEEIPADPEDPAAPPDPDTMIDGSEGIWRSSAQDDGVTVVAPGSKVEVLTEPLYVLGNEMASGASIATPFVSGLLGLLWSANPGLRPERIISALRSSAVLPSDSGPAWGHGRINAPGAIAGVSPDPWIEFVMDVDVSVATRFRELGELVAIWIAAEATGVNVGIIGSDGLPIVLSPTGTLGPAVDLNQSLERSTEELMARIRPENIVTAFAATILVSDRTVPTDASTATDLARHAGIPVHLMAMDVPATHIPTALDQLVTATGGAAVSLESKNMGQATVSFFEQVMRAMRRRVLLSAVLPLDAATLSGEAGFVTSEDDLSLDVVLIKPVGAAFTTDLAIGGKVLERDIPGVDMTGEGRIVFYRVSTGTPERTGHWRLRVRPAGQSAADLMGVARNEPAFGVVVAARHKAALELPTV